jgi:hypothetical protein
LFVDITGREREIRVFFCRVERGKGTEGKKTREKDNGLEERSDDDDDYGV